jgi:hypothetical protein
MQLVAGPQLFVDDYLLAAQAGVSRVVNHPEKLPAPIVTGREDSCFQPYVTVLRDPSSGRYRIWYGVPEGPARTHLAYMESEDGVHFTRPHRVLRDPAPIQFGTSILDEGPDYPDPAKRYKYGWWYGGGLQVAASADGLDWTPLAPGVVLHHDHDINCIFRDPIRGRYMAMVSSYTTGPTWKGQRRIPMESTSDDLVHWREPWPVITPVDGEDPGETQYYCMGGLVARGGLLVGMLRVLRDDLPADAGGPVAGIGYTVLAWSRDGENWQRDREAFLDRNPASGTWDHAMAWADCQLIVGDETRLYYGGYARGHKIERFTERQLGLARMPRDRYVARRAGARRGRLVTVLFMVSGTAIKVNTNARGYLRARLLDQAGRPYPGFDFGDCAEVRGDAVAHRLEWRAKLGDLRGRAACLEFALREADLYGFECGN